MYLVLFRMRRKHILRAYFENLWMKDYLCTPDCLFICCIPFGAWWCCYHTSRSPNHWMLSISCLQCAWLWQEALSNILFLKTFAVPAQIVLPTWMTIIPSNKFSFNRYMSRESNIVWDLLTVPSWLSKKASNQCMNNSGVPYAVLITLTTESFVNSISFREITNTTRPKRFRDIKRFSNLPDMQGNLLGCSDYNISAKKLFIVHPAANSLWFLLKAATQSLERLVSLSLTLSTKFGRYSSSLSASSEVLTSKDFISDRDLTSFM